ncbi:MAG: HAMP domain-containing histidine kinase, partial [Planctomycetes bacterium]|nr:HAMP domain-containing histidine kinase [Planctomycetota bacterium]
RVRDPDKTRRYLEMVLKEAGRIEGMIGNVMDAARLELGRKTLHFAPVAPAELIAGVEKARRLLLEEAGFALEVAVEGEVPEILGDREVLQNALLNLVENAAKYSPERKEIRLSARRRGSEAVLSVEDRGMGIPPEEKARLFERFRRAGPAMRAAGGVGLGLSLVLETVRAHGGRIEVEAREGGGTTFSLAFPAAPAGKDEAEQEDPSEDST